MNFQVIMIRKTLFILMTTMICGQGAGGEVSSRVSVTPLADPRAATTLVCHFSMAGERLHSVKWYREREEIFRFMPQQEPQLRWYNVSEAILLNGSCALEQCAVSLLARPAPAAEYRCEVSSEGPRFRIAQSAANMTVAALPRLDPVIIGAPSSVLPGDNLWLECTSDYSLPTANVTWLLNDKQPPQLWTGALTTSASTALGLSRASRSLHVPVSEAMLSAGGGVLRVRCDAALVLPAYAPAHSKYARSTALRIPVHPDHAQISKFVANGASWMQARCDQLLHQLSLSLLALVFSSHISLHS